MLCSIGCAEKINQQIFLALLEIVKISKIYISTRMKFVIFIKVPTKYELKELAAI